MAIKRIGISNFKSFKNLEVELGDFNLLIGANASGKSNFVQIFQFLRDIANRPLKDAISMQGGAKYLRNTRIGPSQDLSVKVVCDDRFTLPIYTQIREKGPTKTTGYEVAYTAKTYEVIYEFALGFAKKGGGFRISKDVLTVKCDFFGSKRPKRKSEERRYGKGEISFARAGRRITTRVSPPEAMPVKDYQVFPPFIKHRVPARELLLRFPLFLIFPIVPRLGYVFSQLSIYNFDPRLPKKAVPITGKTELEEDGSNLAIVLNNIRRVRAQKKKFTDLIRDLLPFVEELDVERFADRSLFFKLREKYDRTFFLPAFLISDGTINMAAIVIALYFEEKPLIVIEEPERNIHPSLISRVSDMLREASEKKQIIVTTHNPELVRHAPLNDILLMSRDKEGFSTISRPSEKKEVRTFLKNEIGIESLYIQNLLEE